MYFENGSSLPVVFSFLCIILSFRWINNCVGAKNQKYFILYLIYVFIGEVFAVIIGGCYIYQIRSELKENSEFIYFCDIYPLNQYLPSWFANHIFLITFDSEIIVEVLVMIEVFSSVLFAIFSLVLLYNQYTTIRFDCSYVEYLKVYHVKTMEVGVWVDLVVIL